MIKCPKCGWEYPDSYPRKDCKFCKAVMSEYKRCPICMTKKHESEFVDNRCKTCMTERQKMYMRMDPDINAQRIRTYKLRQGLKISEKTNELRQLIEQASVNKTLTEADWLKACRYFGGCALCGDEQIETRTYFVPFKEGGKYNALNILPTCGLCGLKLSTVKDNPFVIFSKGLSPNSIKYSEEQLDKIMNYFRGLV